MFALKITVNKKGEEKKIRNGTLLFLLPDMNYMRDLFLSPQYKIRLTRCIFDRYYDRKISLFRLSWLFILF